MLWRIKLQFALCMQFASIAYIYRYIQMLWALFCALSTFFFALYAMLHVQFYSGRLFMQYLPGIKLAKDGNSSLSDR
jgi:hypothetical protein